MSARATLDNGVRSGNGLITVTYTVPHPDIALTKTADTTQAHVGDTVTYTYAAANTGNVPLHDVHVTDDTCTPVTFVGGNSNNNALLDPGEIWVYTCAYAVTAESPDPIHNVATVAASDDFGAPITDQAEATVDVLHPSISVAKRASVASASAGNTVTYTFTVTNPGDTPLTITVSDPKCDSGTLSGPSGDANSDSKLDPTETWTYTCTHKVVAGDGPVLHNVVTVNGTDALGGPKGTVSDTDSTDVSVLPTYTILGFFSPAPKSKWKIGTTVPVKVALALDGVRISDADAAALLSPPCRVLFSAASNPSVPQTCMKYDSLSHQFIYNWKIASGTSAAVNVPIKVTVNNEDGTPNNTKSENIKITK
jgi:uncharacterized repeat protein (TIGR01451 family)